MPAESYEKHLEKSLEYYEKKSEKAKYCMTADCRGVVELLDDELQNYTCEVCRHFNCFICKATHTGKSCDEFLDEYNPEGRNQRDLRKTEKAIEDLITTNQAMRCPRCNVVVMKISGCDFIKCTVCELGICWITRKPREQLILANGTVIEGCGCNWNKLCHPLCSCCH